MFTYMALHAFIIKLINPLPLQRYQFVAEDLQDKGHLGEGAFGTVSKMLFTKTNTMMAVKVQPS